MKNTLPKPKEYAIHFFITDLYRQTLIYMNILRIHFYIKALIILLKKVSNLNQIYRNTTEDPIYA